MRIQSRLIAAILIALLLTVALDGWIAFDHERHQAIATIRAQAETLRNVLMSVRRVYHREFIASGLEVNDSTVGLLPAHAMNEVSRDLGNWDTSGITVNNVSDRPRNPRQRADAVEMEAITHFRANPGEEVLFRPFTGLDGKAWYLYARPIVVEEYCLGCHGRPEDAPEAVRARYDDAFGYQVGDLRGILSIKLPAADLDRRVWNGFLGHFALHGLSFVVLAGVVALMFRLYVHRPIGRLQSAMAGLAEGRLDTRLGGVEGELGRLQKSFNQLASRLDSQNTELRHLGRAVEQAPVSVVITRPDGTITYVNPFFETVTGYRRDEVVGHRPSVLKSGHMPDEMYRDLWRTISGGGVWHGQFVNRRKDGSLYWEQAVISPVRGDDGTIVNFVGVKEDVTKARHRDEQLLRSLTELNRAHGRLRRFASVAAHDLQEPLRTVISFAQLLYKRHHGRLGADADELLAHAMAGAHRMKDQLLGLIRYLELDTGEIPVTDVDLAELAATVLRDLGLVLGEAGAVACVGGLPVVRGDPVLLADLLAQLVENAVKFRVPGRPCRLWITAERGDGEWGDGEWTIRVADNGQGVPVENREAVFDIYVRLHPEGRYPGAGVGLALCARIVERHGGSIRLDPPVGEQSTVVAFTLPA
ncbi:MAG: DUF3365 domain-containing protein [Pseudomonadota bacterium]